jgi:hypothetical protein
MGNLSMLINKTAIANFISNHSEKDTGVIPGVRQPKILFTLPPITKMIFI